MDHFELSLEARPLTINKERSMPYRARALVVREWRDSFYILAADQRMPGFAWIEVGVHPVLPNRRWTQDLGNCLPSVKAAIDGLVDYGVIPDDTDAFVRVLTFHPTTFTPGRRAGLTLHVVGHDRQAKRWVPKRRVNKAYAQRMDGGT